MTAKAACSTTKEPRRRASARFSPSAAPPSFRPEEMSVRRTRIAGMTTMSRLVATVSSPITPTTRQPRVQLVQSRAAEPGFPAALSSSGKNQLATSRPASDASTASVTLSTASNRTMRHRRPPSASRMLSSRRWPSMRTSMRFEALRQAMA